MFTQMSRLKSLLITLQKNGSHGYKRVTERPESVDIRGGDNGTLFITDCKFGYRNLRLNTCYNSTKSFN